MAKATGCENTEASFTGAAVSRAVERFAERHVSCHNLAM
jgi:hypothetical protein